MHWRAKGVVQKVLGHAPGGVHAHYLLQRRFGGLRNLGDEFEAKLGDWRLMVSHLRDAGRSIVDARLLEIGSGWYPAFPFACFLGGARNVITVDCRRRLKAELARDCAIELSRFTSFIADACGVLERDVRERQRQLERRLAECFDLHAATDGVVTYDAPVDATNTRFGPQQLDCVFSNCVLEHVRPDAIDGIFREALRILSPGGLMFHSINCGDHYASIDRGITRLNYLKYSDTQWRRWNNPFLYQNRLRAFEFTERAQSAGFQILMSTENPPASQLRELAGLRVHPQFAHIPPERLCVTSVDFVARKPDAVAP
ncbi:class I SAM-dependent methyltransferase [Dyella soli]|nr:class I SAM-dependent methyltransferase [Dyella soli]